MDFIISTTPIFVIVFVLAVFFMLVVVMLGIREILESRVLHHYSVKVDKNHKTRPITVFVEMLGGIDSIIPTLDHLYSHNYAGLKIVVFINSSAGIRDEMKLKKYGRAHGYRGLKLINGGQEINIQEVVRLYGVSSLFMILKTGEYLSDGFLEIVSIKSTYVTGEIVAWPQQVMILNNKITNAIKALEIIMRQFTNRITGKKIELRPIIPGIVYRKNGKTIDFAKKNYTVRPDDKLYILDSNIKTALSDNLFDSINKSEFFLVTLRGALTVGVLIFLTSIAFILLDSRDLILLIISVAVIYTLSAIVAQTQSGYYSLIDNISLALLSPLSLIYNFVVLICSFVKLVFNFIYTVLKKKLLSSNGTNNN